MNDAVPLTQDQENRSRELIAVGNLPFLATAPTFDGAFQWAKAALATITTLREQLQYDRTMDSWARHLGSLYRKPKSHKIDELCLLTYDLVDQDQRLGQMRAAIADMIDTMKLEQNIMGMQLTTDHLLKIDALFKKVVGAREIHQRLAERDKQ